MSGQGTRPSLALLASPRQPPERRQAHQAEKGALPAAHRLMPTRAVRANDYVTRALNPQNHL